MQNGEVDGQVIGLGSIKAGQPHLWNEKLVKPMVQFGHATRLAELGDVPTGREMVSDPKGLALVELAEMTKFMELPFVESPGMPADRTKDLQTACMAMHKDKSFLDEANTLEFAISTIDRMRTSMNSR